MIPSMATTYKPEFVGGPNGFALIPRSEMLTNPKFKDLVDVAQRQHLLTDVHPGMLGVAWWLWNEWTEGQQSQPLTG